MRDQPPYCPPCPPFLCVVYADEDLVVISKPAGLLTVPGRDPALADCVEARAKAIWKNARIVHRLDMATSGLLVLARGYQALKHLSGQFEAREVEKRYVALVAGSLAQDDGVIDLPLACDWPNRPRQQVDHERGKAAVTRWQVRHRLGRGTVVDLFPVTGRSHQLRVHMAEIGHPILGDPFYGTPASQAAASRLMLHAEELQITHPATGTAIGFTDPWD